MAHSLENGWDVQASGSTAVAALWKDNRIWTANCGDSRCAIGTEADRKVVFETEAVLGKHSWGASAPGCGALHWLRAGGQLRGLTLSLSLRSSNLDVRRGGRPARSRSTFCEMGKLWGIQYCLAGQCVSRHPPLCLSSATMPKIRVPHLLSAHSSSIC